EVCNADAAFLREPFIDLEHLCQASRFVALPVLLRRQPDTRAVRTTALVGTTECTGAVPGGADQLAQRQTAAGNLLLERSHVVVALACRHRVLPDQVFGRHFRADVA